MMYFIAIVAVIIDQLTKIWAKTALASSSIPVIKNVLHFTYLENTGAAFGMFAKNTTILSIFSVVAVVAIIYALTKFKPKGKLIRISSGLIMGGALGNVIDRIFRKAVIDFIDFRIINYPIFNFADICVVVGAILAMIWIIKSDKNEEC